MTLALDGHAAASGSVSGTGTISATLTTTSTDDVIIACIYNEAQGHTAGPHDVSGVTGGGLTWTQRSKETSTAFNGSSMEVWWAHAPSALSSTSITATFSGTTDDASIIVFGVSGANTSAPFDTDVSLPAKTQATASSIPSISGVSVTSAASLVFGAAGSQTFFASPGDLVKPASAIDNTNTAAGSGLSSLIAAYDVNALAVSSQTYSVNRTCGAWIFIVDAIVPASTDVDITASADVGMTETVTLDVISPETDITVSMLMGASMGNPTPIIERDITASVALGFNTAAALSDDLDIVDAVATGFAASASVTIERDLAASMDVGMLMGATPSIPKKRRTVILAGI